MTVLTRPTVAVTGLNGFIATHVALKFLEEGWDVRGSFRSDKSAGKIAQNPTWTKWVDEGRLKAIVVPDINGDLTELLDGVQAISHLAAPIALNNTWESFSVPAIEGTLNVLEHANKIKTIQSVGLMSSFAAMADLAETHNLKDVVFNEDSWGPYDEQDVSGLDPKTNPLTPVLWYAASKQLLEVAVKKWIATNNPAWPVSVFCPPMVYGPVLQASSLSDLASLNGSVPDFINLIKGKDEPLPMQFSTIMVDVRDVAQAFYLSADKKKGGRYFVAGAHYTFQQFVDTFRKLRPDLDAYFPLGDPSATPKPFDYTYDNSKSIKELGIEYTPVEKTLSDALDHFEALGVFKIPPGSWVEKK